MDTTGNSTSVCTRSKLDICCYQRHELRRGWVACRRNRDNCWSVFCGRDHLVVIDNVLSDLEICNLWSWCGQQICRRFEHDSFQLGRRRNRHMDKRRRYDFCKLFEHRLEWNALLCSFWFKYGQYVVHRCYILDDGCCTEQLDESRNSLGRNKLRNRFNNKLS